MMCMGLCCLDYSISPRSVDETIAMIETLHLCISPESFYLHVFCVINKDFTWIFSA